MLQDIKEEFTFQKVKAFIFDKYSTLVALTYPSSSPSLLMILIQIIIQSILSTSIIFQQGLQQYWNTEEISFIIKYSKYINLPNLYTNALIDLIIQATVIGILLLFIILFVIFMATGGVKTLALFIVQLKRILLIFCVPYFYVITYNWVCQGCYDLHYVTNPLLTSIFIIYFVSVSLTIKLHFNPIPKDDNILASLNSDFDLYTFWFNFAKILVYQYNGMTIQFVGIVLVISIGKIHYIKKIQEEKICFAMRIPDYISILTCSLILFSQFNSAFAFGAFALWCVGILLILVTLVFKWFGVKHKNLQKVYDCLDAAEREIILMAQEFMKVQWTTLTGPQLSQYLTYICFHINRCTFPKCFLKQSEPTLKKINLNHLQQHSSELRSIFLKYLLNLLQKYNLSSSLVCTQYLMLCHHTHQPLSTLNIAPTSSLCQQFVRYLIEMNTASQDHNEDVNITEETYQQEKSQLLAQFNKVITSLKGFLIELKVKKPNIDVLMKQGYNAYKEIQNLKKIFMRILRSDFFDLKIIQVYMEFMVNLLKQQQLCEYISRVSKHKWSNSANNLQLLDSSVPSLHIDPDQDKIFNMNAEAIKVLKFHRIDIYDKKVSGFLHPFNDEQTLRSLFDSLIMKSQFCFIRDSTDNMIPVIVSSRIKRGNKQVSILEIQCLNRLKQEAFILIDNNHEFIQSHPQELCSSKHGIFFNTKDLYQNTILEQIQQLRSAKFVNLQYQGCLVHAIFSETIHKDYFYIKINLKKKVQKGTLEESVVQQLQLKRLQFCPNIQFKENKVSKFLINGQFRMEEEGSQQVSINMEFLDTRCQGLIQEFTTNYAEGIKSYRLQGDMIYNIQLEQNPQEKAEVFEEDHFVVQKQQDQNVRRKKIKIFYGIMILLAVLYLGIHIAVIAQKLSILKKQSTEHPLQIMLKFQTRFQRLFGILRDAYLNTKYVTATYWNKQIKNLFDTIQKDQTSLKFSKNLVYFQLLGQKYTSFLDYACNIFITEIYRMSLMNNTLNFLQVNQKSQQYIDPAISAEKQTMYSSLQLQLKNYMLSHVYTIVSHAVIILGILGMIMCINSQYKNQKQSVMLPWRSISDEEIQSLIDKLGTFEVLLILSDRNQDVEIFDSLKETTAYKKREYPKDFSRTSDRRNFYWVIFVVILLVLGLGIHGYSFILAKNQTQSIKNSLLVHLQLASSYIQLVKASKYNSAITNISVITMNNIVNDLQRTIPSLTYNHTFIQTLNVILFDEHCQIMKQIVPNLTVCDNYSIGFFYPNPFIMGYLIDVTALTFSMVDNITNLYICSGLIGYAYEIGVAKFIDMMVEQKIIMIEQFYNDEVGYSMTSILLVFLVFITILLVYTTSITGLKRIQLISKLLNISVQEKKQKKQKSKGKQYQKIPDAPKEEI